MPVSLSFPKQSRQHNTKEMNLFFLFYCGVSQPFILYTGDDKTKEKNKKKVSCSLLQLISYLMSFNVMSIKCTATYFLTNKWICLFFAFLCSILAVDDIIYGPLNPLCKKEKPPELELAAEGDDDAAAAAAFGIGQVLRPIAAQWVAQLKLVWLDNWKILFCRLQHQSSPLSCCAQNSQIEHHGVVTDRPVVSTAANVPAANMIQSLLPSVLHFLALLLLLTAVAVGAAPLGTRPSGVERIGRCPASNTNSSPLGVLQSANGAPCRHFFKQRYGILSTPGFPSAFPVPFICSWIIDATAFEPDSFITLYLTQMYLTRGVQVGFLYLFYFILFFLSCLLNYMRLVVQSSSLSSLFTPFKYILPQLNMIRPFRIRSATRRTTLAARSSMSCTRSGRVPIRSTESKPVTWRYRWIFTSRSTQTCASSDVLWTSTDSTSRTRSKPMVRASALILATLSIAPSTVTVTLITTTGSLPYLFIYLFIALQSWSWT